MKRLFAVIGRQATQNGACCVPLNTTRRVGFPALVLFMLATTGLLGTIGLNGVQRAEAQLVTSTSYSLDTLILGRLLGPGIVAYNFTYTGNANALGFFKGTTNLGMDSGLVLTTGSVLQSSGTWPGGGNNSCNNGTDNGEPGDADLAAASGFLTFNAAILEFDFIPTSDLVKFDFVFGSEEYDDFVGGTVNDAFGFFLSGVTVVMPSHNIALIPGTNTPITINDVNNGSAGCGSVAGGPCSNCAYYVNNFGGTTIQYDAFTTVLTAFDTVLCGEVYHIKIAIADAGDGVYDSGVFLRALSFTGGTVSILPDTSTAAAPGSVNDSTYIEGCGEASFNIYRTANTTNAEAFSLNYSGTATFGVDYLAPTTVNFLPGDTLKKVTVQMLGDVVFPEPIEVIEIDVLSNSTCFIAEFDTIKIYIKDVAPMSTTAFGDTTIGCPSDSATLYGTAVGGRVPPGTLTSYTWEWSAPMGNVIDSFRQISVAPQVTTTYYLQAADTCGNVSFFDSVVVEVATYAQLKALLPDTIYYCPEQNQNIRLTATAEGGAGQYTFLWMDGQVGPDALFSPTGATDTYTVTVTDRCGVTASEDVVAVPSVTLAAFSLDSVDYDKIQFTNLSDSTTALSYNWQFGDGRTDTARNPLHTYTDTGSYIVTLTAFSEFGCRDTMQLSVYIGPAFNLFLPNAFSPDGDGVNDVFLGKGFGIVSLNMQVFNRWGQLMFETNDADKGWDGLFNGQPVPAGVYSYSLVATGLFNTNFATTGTIQLIR